MITQYSAIAQLDPETGDVDTVLSCTKIGEWADDQRDIADGFLEGCAEKHIGAYSTYEGDDGTWHYGPADPKGFRIVVYSTNSEE